MKWNLGDTPDQKEFVREFLDRRRKKQSVSNHTGATHRYYGNY